MSDAVIDRDAQGIGASRPFLAQGAGEDLDSLRKRFAGLIVQPNFNQGNVNSPLAGKLSALNAEKLGDISGTFDRNLPFAYAQRQKTFQGVSDANQNLLREEEIARKQQEMAKQAKRRALITGAMGLAGAGVGAAYGGPAGAQIGAGIGTTAGSQF